MNQRYPFIYYTLMLVIILVMLAIHFYFGGIIAVLKLNEQHNPFLDFLFKYITLLGEVFSVAFVLFFFLLKKEFKWLLTAVYINLGAIAVALISKNIVFKSFGRPRKVLNNDALIHFIEGVKVNIDHSYPSGHTLMAAVAATILAYYFKHNKLLQIALFLIVVLVALSRVYLFQHFFIDVATSMSIALFWSGFVIYIMRHQLNNSNETI